jgi:hypothetical protein
MRFQFQKRPDVKPWHRWYAWHPVKIGRVWFWFEPVERMGEWDWCENDYDYKYRRLREAD